MSTETITIDRAVLFAAYLAVVEARDVLDTRESLLGYRADAARRALRRAWVALESPRWEQIERDSGMTPMIEDRQTERTMFALWRRECATEIADAEFDHLVAGPFP